MDTSKHDFWLAHFKSWQASQLTAQAFCQSHSLNYDQFLYWRRKFSPAKQTPSAGFAKVVSKPTALAPDRGLVVHLPNGIKLSGLHADNVDVAATLLRAL